MKITAYTRIQRAALPPGHFIHDRIGYHGDRLLRDSGAVDLRQVRGDLPVGQPLRRQGKHQAIDPGQPPLPFSDDYRLETGIPVAGYRDIHRPGLGQHRLGPVAVAGIAAITARPIMLAVTQMIIELALERSLDHHLRQPAQQPALTGQLQPAGAGPLGKLAQQLLIGRRQLHGILVLRARHISHWCLLRLWSYTVETTVPRCAWRGAGS